MGDAEAEIITERAVLLAGQMPTTDEALACMDCSVIFRRGSECPRCQSRSLWNLAEFLSKGAN